jgi:hypothetical protein
VAALSITTNQREQLDAVLETIESFNTQEESLLNHLEEIRMRRDDLDDEVYNIMTEPPVRSSIEWRVLLDGTESKVGKALGRRSHRGA